MELYWVEDFIALGKVEFFKLFDSLYKRIFTVPYNKREGLSDIEIENLILAILGIFYKTKLNWKEFNEDSYSLMYAYVVYETQVDGVIDENRGGGMKFGSVEDQDELKNALKDNIIDILQRTTIKVSPDDVSREGCVDYLKDEHLTLIDWILTYLVRSDAFKNFINFDEWLKFKIKEKRYRSGLTDLKPTYPFVDEYDDSIIQ